MSDYSRDNSLIINGRSYYLESFGKPEIDGSRRATMKLNHESICQIMQQDGDDKTCTCLLEIDFPELTAPSPDKAKL